MKVKLALQFEERLLMAFCIVVRLVQIPKTDVETRAPYNPFNVNFCGMSMEKIYLCTFDGITNLHTN